MNKYIFVLNKFEDYRAAVLPSNVVDDQKLWEYIYHFFSNHPNEKYLHHFINLVQETVEEKQNLTYNLEVYSVNK